MQRFTKIVGDNDKAGREVPSGKGRYKAIMEHARGKLEMISEVLQALAAKLKHAHEHRSATLNLRHAAALLGGSAAELDALIQEIDRQGTSHDGQVRSNLRARKRKSKEKIG